MLHQKRFKLLADDSRMLVFAPPLDEPLGARERVPHFWDSRSRIDRRAMVPERLAIPTCRRFDETQTVDMPQVFMPCATNAKGQTLYETQN